MENKQGSIEIEKIREIISQFTDVDLEDIKMESDLRCDLGLTSFDLACMISSFEEEFGISRDTKILKKVKTVGDACKVILSGEMA
ncbi:acyl carrier protein [Acetivibrio clariflavus]|uniref:acyl carrier protein n=1 Tax=Acetivibrio clariflavus TaxID=288965 RepID=UPI0004B9B229|nr:phosphopantetheine-binding protein [Acetivibrio clariflavus]